MSEPAAQPDVELGHLELEDLLTELRERAGDVLESQQRLRGLLNGVRSLSGQLALGGVLVRLVELAQELTSAKAASFTVAPDVFYDGEREISVGDRNGEQAVEMVLELRSRSGHFGTLALMGRQDGTGDDFSDDERQVVRTLSAAASIAVQNAQSYEALARRRAWTVATGEIIDAVLDQSRSREAVFELICQRAVELSGAWYGIIVLPSRPGFVRIDHVYGSGGQQLLGVELDEASSLSGLCMRTGELIVSENPGSDDRADKGVRGIATSRTILVPMKSGDSAPAGVVSVIYPTGAPPLTDDDFDMMKGFAAQAALAREFAQAQQDRTQVAILEDRDRIGVELHDLVIQRIFAIGMSVQSATRLVDPATAQRLMKVVDELDATIRDLRQTVFQTARGDEPVHDLLQDLQAIVAEIGVHSSAKIETEVVGNGAKVGPEVRTQLLAVAREALSNAVRHSKAESITVAFVIDDHATVIVADDGIGVPEDPSRRSGTANLETRARGLGGEFSLRNRPTGGAVARWSVPL